MPKRRRAVLTPLLAIVALSLSLSGCQVAGIGSPEATAIPTAAPTATEAPATPTAASTGQNTNGTGSAAAAKQWTSPPKMTIDVHKTYKIVMQTNKGDFTITLLPKEAPLAANNFLFLVQHHFYNGIKFHRIIKSFMIQGGDPQGDGTGGPGYGFAIEPPAHDDYTKGMVAMANTGQPNSNGSQFFIMTTDNSGKLPKTYSIFGKVTAGLQTIDKIASVPVDDPNSQSPRPLQDVVITSATVQS